MKTLCAAALLLSFATAAHAEEGPCKQVKEACEKAGFVKGEAKTGKGLWVDCVVPLMQGTANKKATLPLPTVDAGVISACKTKNPKFGAGKNPG